MTIKALIKNLSVNELPQTVAECHSLIRLLLKTVEELSNRIDKLELENAFLKERLNVNSENSSLPPSKDFKKKKSHSHHPSGRPSGGQVGHAGHFRALVSCEEVDRIVKCDLPTHCECGGEIDVLEDYQRHQVYELPEIKLPITEYQLMKGRCRCCCQHHVACLPEGVSSGITGARLTSMMSLLVSKYHLSRRGLQEFLEEYFHFHISLGTVFNKQRLVNTVLEEPVKGLLEVAQRKDFLHADETGHRENSRRSWMWTFATPELAYFEV